MRTLPVSLSGVLLAVGLTKWSGCFRLVPALLCIVFALLAQIVSNLANEYFDFKAGVDKAGRAGFRRGVTEGDITPRAMKRAMIGTLIATCAVGLCMLAVVDSSHWAMLMGVGVAVAIAALAYSAGPYPLSHHALGEVAVMLFYGLVPVIFTYFVVAQRFSPFAIMAGFATGFMGVNVLLVNNYRDADDDRTAGKRTSVVVFGKPLAVMAYLLNGLLAISVLGGLWLRLYISVQWLCLLPVAVYLLLHFATWDALRHRTGSALNPVLGATARNMLLFTIVLLVVLMLSQ